MDIGIMQWFIVLELGVPVLGGHIMRIPLYIRASVGVPLFWETARKPLLNRTMAFVVAGFPCQFLVSAFFWGCLNPKPYEFARGYSMMLVSGKPGPTLPAMTPWESTS